MDVLKVMRSVAGHKAADEDRQEADRLLYESRKTQFVAATRYGGKHTAVGREMLAEAELLRIDAKQKEEEEKGARWRANMTAYHEASKLLREARAAGRKGRKA